MRKNKVRVGILMVVVALVMAASPSMTLMLNHAQAQEDQSNSAEKRIRKKPRGRVPNHYGKLGLSPKQKETIYGIQSKYDDQIEALEKQLADLERQEDEEVEAVLTDDQKKRLQEILAEVDARRKRKSSD